MRYYLMAVLVGCGGLLILSEARGQAQAGYIIKSNGAVENGRLEILYDFFKGCSVRFRSVRGKTTRYSADNLQGFSLNDSTYISLSGLDFRISGQSGIVIQQDFVRVWLDEVISLVEHRYKTEQVWLASPTRSYFIIHNTQTGALVRLPQEPQAMAMAVAEYCRDAEELYQEIMQTPLDNNNKLPETIRYLRAYNDWLKSR